MCISGLYAKHLNLYMTNRIIIYPHIFTKVFDKIVNKTMITSTFWIDCFFTLTLCINASTRRKITSSAVIFNKYYCKINFYLNNITQITSHRKLRWRDMIHTHFYSYNYYRSQKQISQITLHRYCHILSFAGRHSVAILITLKYHFFTNNLTVWGSLGSSNIWLLTVYSFALKQFVSNLYFILPFQWQHEKPNRSPWLNVDYKQLLENIIATVVWR